MEPAGGFEIVEGVTWADTAIRVYGPRIEDIFINAGKALIAVLIDNPEDLDNREARVVSLSEENIEILLFTFLGELVYLKDAELFLGLPCEVSVFVNEERARLECMIHGEKIDRSRHRFNVDVKAVTMHHLEVSREVGGWKGTVVLDV